MKKIYIAVIALLNLIVATGCFPSRENELAGKWKLETYTDPSKATLDATDVQPGETYVLQFHETGTFGVNTDCNTISGEYSVAGQKLHLSNLSTTEIACEKEKVERSLKCQLPMVESYRFPNDTTLCLLGRQGNILVELVKVRDIKR